MGYLTCTFVRPDKQIFEGKVASVVLATYTGELGILPGHASEICALGNGVVRMNLLPEDGGGVRRVVVSGGYAEVHKNTVVVIADHARREDDIEPNVVLATRKAAEESRDALPEDDHQRAYYENKIAWCNQLLAQAEKAGKLKH